ncbi:hypothetical protein Kpol_416p5 [Vanderwaltozyma polyspora DSM 70294]|uniref:Major facilitator superfamily (MFS) profile domain-containing protein n=1 Tax=Vanderwaltozyma polyspora (strain ATCC 22028 / DSM 70294 / BCRC 21397 / CBS 2163 / NBRC 10782 / NRRL Y-8283 / UCD 57-17) TaxID=436907 RepID=A7TRL7_VANPO|nr:uncharacterized protein Kpol_416p5 [Vanderwaltozyma polyspora DSM 70294]EDO15090.1 hypothetical protein Kpol_416p5 [Vanderwaltozyma polyspora DSM 70294]
MEINIKHNQKENTEFEYSEELPSSTSESDHISSHSDAESDKFGVHNVEIYAKYYSTPVKRFLIFFSLFTIAYAYGLDNSVRGTYQTLATSSYNQHSLLSTVSCIKAVISAAAQIWFARSADMFGRTTILMISIVFYVVGTVVESQAVDVSKFAAGACLYAVGHSAIVLFSEVYVADFSNLNWRVTAAAAPLLPNVINTWISGDITAAIDENWKWGIGMWAFIFPLSCIPMGACILHMKYLAKKNKDDLKVAFKKPEHYTWSQYLVDVFFWKLDLVGLLLLVAIFGMILIPFTLAGGEEKVWSTARIIVPEVLGWAFALPLFLVWEIKFARYPLTPKDALKNRGIVSALVLVLFLQFAYQMQSTYLYTVLLVAVDESKKSATRINKLFSFVSVITGFLSGFVVAKVRRTKEFIFFGIGVWFISFGLMIRYTGGLDSHVGIIVARCILGFGNGFLKFPARASIQASAYSHEMMAVMTSLFLAVSSIGSAFGDAVAGSIWTNVLPGKISEGITNETLADYAYGSPTKFILKYKWDTPERQAVVEAYKVIGRLLNIVGICLLVPLLISAFFLKNRRLEDVVSFDKFDKMNSENAEDSVLEETSKEKEKEKV